MKDYLGLLGYEVRDRVTGFAGVVDSVCFDLYGCVQVAITPKYNDSDKERKLGAWFDFKRVKKISDKPIMEQPSFTSNEAGPAYKPPR